MQIDLTLNLSETLETCVLVLVCLAVVWVLVIRR